MCLVLFQLGFAFFFQVSSLQTVCELGPDGPRSPKANRGSQFMGEICVWAVYRWFFHTVHIEFLFFQYNV